MAQSGLDNILKRRLEEDSLVYGGSSAGAIVVTPGLQGVELGDDPGEIPKGYPKRIIWNGLNLVEFHIVPHYQSDWFGKEAAEMEKYLQANNLSYRTLKDGQVIIVDHDKKEFFA
jgi:dipeptidase E